MTVTLTPANGLSRTCTRVRVQWSSLGLWWADVDTPDPGDSPPIELGTRVTITVHDSQYSGTVVSGGDFDGRGAYRIVAGAGGWSREIPSKGYQNDLGVSIATLVADLAQAAGEPTPVGASALGRVGSNYTRKARRASRTLHALMPEAWHTRADGVVVCAAPLATPYTGEAIERAYDVALGVTRLACDEAGLRGLEPGVTFRGRPPASDVEIVASADTGLAVTLWHAARPLSRRLAAFAEIMAQLDPRRDYRACYEYRIVGQSGERLDLQPVRRASGMSDLARVPVRPGMAGLKATHLPGSLCVVTFLDADPSRPIVVAFDEADSPGWMPLGLDLGGPGALGVARMTDPVIAGPFAGTIVSGSVRVKAAL